MADLARVLSNKTEDMLIAEVGGNTLESVLRERPQRQRRPSYGQASKNEAPILVRRKENPAGEKSEAEPPEGPFVPAPAGKPKGGGGKPPLDEGALERELFGKPLTRERYFERDWFWIRCHTQGRYSVGGSWPGPYGKHWLDEMKKMSNDCGPVINWTFQYMNGQDWGDAAMRADWFSPTCQFKGMVEAATRAAKLAGKEMQRELYIYSCTGFESEPGFMNEIQEWSRYKAGKQAEAGG